MTNCKPWIQLFNHDGRSFSRTAQRRPLQYSPSCRDMRGNSRVAFLLATT
ncbi:hypothetical protein AZE42_13766 [Rhizopogon vesiculosus]|uniref:Uncharacterized protein n=1 Tax=Rhizopogon vesiculosus TaxID=180088 RepID=A0A1J8QKH1_9AGAM|nr:hypothetical protein AZE42_13766 [Rhizopogon vesiculosus]